MTKKFDARNAEKSRAVCEAMAERADTGKRIMSEREKLILDMWPKFEDGEYVWFGDEVDGLRGGIDNIDLYERTTNLYDVDVNLIMSFGERLKRPAPKVLDADGVEIKVGNTVWHRSLCTMGSMRKATVIGFDENSLGGKLATLKDEAGKTWYIDPKKITHVQPDSWERLEEDAADLDDMPCDFNAKDLVRRAKALAGAEAGR